MNKLSLVLPNAGAVEGFAAKARDGTLWLHLNGETYTVVPPKPKSRRGAGAGGPAPTDIMAPMPGKIIKLHAKVGDEVTSGQVLLVMEAMKMEYTLKASASGTVEQLECEAGQQVTLGQRLVKLKLWEK